MTRPGNHPFRNRYATPPTVAKWCIWSVANQSWLAGQIRIYIWGAVALLAVFILTGVISPEIALASMFISGIVLATAIWLLIRQRKYWLLHIRQPELRRQALAAMVAYLDAINYPLPRQAPHSQIQDNNPDEEADFSHSR
jgi:predicted lysophospholipase L1 biosynthesis ABC-type transport system permease subunit